MATQDDDTLTGPVPDPDAEPTPAELAHAGRFSALIDRTLAGRTPLAMPADDRALLEVATVIRAAHGNLELAPGRQRALIEDALGRAIDPTGGAPRPAGRAVGVPTPRDTASPIGAEPPAGGSVVPIASARGRRWAPWIVAGASVLVAAAALAILWLRPSDPPGRLARVPAEWRSRPADGLIGPIDRDRAGDASARIDAIFADRLDGFRARRLARGGKP